VHSRSAGAPQVEIENMRQLLGRRQRHDLAAIFKPAALNDSVKQIGLQSGDDLFKARRVQNTIEQLPRAQVEMTPVCRLAPCWLVAGRIRAFGTPLLRLPFARTATASRIYGFWHKPPQFPRWSSPQLRPGLADFTSLNAARAVGRLCRIPWRSRSRP